MNKHREIKFRAWDEDRKKMIFDFPDEFTTTSYKVFYDSDNERFFCGNYMDNGDWQQPVLMQSVGLKDLKGNWVFEGDILNLGPDFLSETNYMAIAYDQKHCRFNVSVESLSDGRFVCGNIYQNPELNCRP